MDQRTQTSDICTKFWAAEEQCFLRFVVYTNVCTCAVKSYYALTDCYEKNWAIRPSKLQCCFSRGFDEKRSHVIRGKKSNTKNGYFVKRESCLRLSILSRGQARPGRDIVFRIQKIEEKKTSAIKQDQFQFRVSVHETIFSKGE